jgi:uncharacterized membrane protein YebE (DUF533 family)
MGIPDGAHTHGGGGFDPMPIVIVLGAVAIAGAVLAAVGELVHILLIVVAVIGGLAAVGLVAFIAYRIRHRDTNADRAMHRITPAEPRPAKALPEPRPAIEPAAEVHIHHHWHGVDAEDVAAIIRHQQEGR